MAEGRDFKDIGKEAKRRLMAARDQKTTFETDFRESYFFAAPHRQRQVTSSTQPSTKKIGDEAELQTTVAFELVPDFATVVVNSIMPEHERWVERRRAPGVSQQGWDQVKAEVEGEDRDIFESMRASALYTEIGKVFAPDLAIGTVGLWIDDPSPAQPVRVMGIPIRELELNIGPDGSVDDRFLVRWIKGGEVESLLGPQVQVPAGWVKKFKDRPDTRFEIRWGFWRDWSARDAETWNHVVMIGSECIHHIKLKGQGCCPLLIGRWNPSPDHAWGYGPLVQALPDLRQADEMEANIVDAVDFAVRPPISFPDDSFANIEEGLEAGGAYPIRAGTEDAVKPIYEPRTIDPGIIMQERREKRLRKLFFVDYPVQTGDTPPSATQWLDEMALAQRRLGTPGMPFWREFACPIFVRFGYLLMKRGIVKDHRADGKTIGLYPSNPMQRAAEMQEVSDNAKFLQIASQIFPEEFKAMVDGSSTMLAIRDKMRATLVQFRTKEQIDASVEMIAKLQGGTPGEAPAGALGGPVPA